MWPINGNIEWAIEVCMFSVYLCSKSYTFMSEVPLPDVHPVFNTERHMSYNSSILIALAEEMLKLKERSGRRLQTLLCEVLGINAFFFLDTFDKQEEIL